MKITDIKSIYLEFFTEAYSTQAETFQISMMDAELCPKRDRDDEDDELTIPRAAMNKMIKELCPQIRVANEAR